METYDPEKSKRYGISPELVADLKGLMGDKSDNIPGVPGVGIKTASKLLKKFGTMEDILKNTDKLKGKQKENIEKYSKQAEISKYLATIVRDMSLDFVLEDFSHKEPDYDRLIDLFRELEFYSLINRVQQPHGMESEIEETTDIKNVDNLKKLADKIKSIKTFSVLIDADKKDFTSYKIKGLYLAVEDKSYYIEYKLLEKDSKVKTILKSILKMIIYTKLLMTENMPGMS